MHVVPSMLAALLTGPDGVLPRSLRRVLAIGEALPASTAQRFRAGNGATLHNLYGPTEAAVSVTDHEVDRCRHGVRADRCRRSGTPRSYVLDARLQPVPAGVPGELYLAGAQLARGYFGAAGSDGGPVRGEPVRRRRADVPHRRPGGVDARRVSSSTWVARTSR